MTNTPNVGNFWHEPDFLLMNLVSLLANKLEADLGITLMVGGSIVTGTLVSERYYLYTLGSIFRNVGRNAVDIPSDIVDLVADALGVEDFTEDEYPERTDDEDEDTDDGEDPDDDLPPPVLLHLHLKDPVWIHPNSTVSFGQNPLPVIRLRLTAIDGWMFGRITMQTRQDDIPNIGLVQ